MADEPLKLDEYLVGGANLTIGVNGDQLTGVIEEKHGDYFTLNVTGRIFKIRNGAVAWVVRPKA